jgi:hypothetical protein
MNFYIKVVDPWTPRYLTPSVARGNRAKLGSNAVDPSLDPVDPVDPQFSLHHWTPSMKAWTPNLRLELFSQRFLYLFFTHLDCAFQFVSKESK